MFYGDELLVYDTGPEGTYFLKEVDGKIIREKKESRGRNTPWLIYRRGTELNLPFYYKDFPIDRWVLPSMTSQDDIYREMLRRLRQVQNTGILSNTGYLYYLSDQGITRSTKNSATLENIIKYKFNETFYGGCCFIAEDGTQVPIWDSLTPGDRSQLSYQRIINAYVRAELAPNEFLYLRDADNNKIELIAVSLDSSLTCRPIGSVPLAYRDFLPKYGGLIYDHQVGDTIFRTTCMGNEERGMKEKGSEEAKADFLNDVLDFASFAEERKFRICGTSEEETDLRLAIMPYIPMQSIIEPPELISEASISLE